MAKPKILRVSPRGKRSRMRKRAHTKRAWALTKEFLKENLSIAGVPSIIRAKSKFRRLFWACIIVTIAGITVYSTMGILSEYFLYPKKLTKKDVINATLDFPAVTICPLTKIEKEKFFNTSVQRLNELSDFAVPNKAVPAVKVGNATINACFQNPMCYWSIFYDRCFCLKSPCDTEFCFLVEKDICTCAGVFCEDENTPWEKSCYRKPGGYLDWYCTCYNNFSYAYETPVREASEDTERLVQEIENPKVKDAAKLILESETNDLSDLTEGLYPTLNDITNNGIKFKTFMISCTYEKKRCTKGDFKIFYHPSFGKCFMFNFVGNNPGSRRISNSGSRSGLQLYLKVEEAEDVVDIFTPEFGVRVTIHDPHELPPILEEGINVARKVKTYFGISLSQHRLLSTPLSFCSEDWVDAFEGESLMSIGKYTSLFCQKLCLSRYIKEKCGCLERSLQHGRVLPPRSTKKTPMCDMNNTTQGLCIGKLLTALDSDTFPCICPWRCFKNNYDISTSNAILNKQFLKQVQRGKTLRRNESGWYYTAGEELSSLVGIQVYYKTLQVEKLCEELSYSWKSLVANIGGNCGFFMGFTVVSLFEIVEFFLDFLTFLCCNSEKRSSKNRKFEGGDFFVKPDPQYVKNVWTYGDNVRVLKKVRHQGSRLSRKRIRSSRESGIIRKPSLISPNYYLGGLYM